jgi:hypothetical protein
MEGPTEEQIVCTKQPASSTDRTCSICMREGMPDGIECDGNEHHFCCQECLAAHVTFSCEDQMQRQQMRAGRVCCPHCSFPPASGSCMSAPFSEQAIAILCDAQVFGRYQVAASKLTEARLAREADAMLQLRVKTELSKMEEMGVELFGARKHIIEKILTLSCPRCGQAFLDFSGCMALSCSAADCGCAFCGWCLHDCGHDSHAHVRNCPVRPIGMDTYFATSDQYQEAWKHRRIDLLEEFLATKEQSLQKRILDNVKLELKDLGLDSWTSEYQRRDHSAHKPDSVVASSGRRRAARQAHAGYGGEVGPAVPAAVRQPQLVVRRVTVLVSLALLILSILALIYFKSCWPEQREFPIVYGLLQSVCNESIPSVPCGATFYLETDDSCQCAPVYKLLPDIHNTNVVLYRARADEVLEAENDQYDFVWQIGSFGRIGSCDDDGKEWWAKHTILWSYAEDVDDETTALPLVAMNGGQHSFP